jgi:aminoglycoside phosphotransferase (APT) family kinase protein
VELFGLKLANARGVPAPKLIADGVVEDKYDFRYMIMDYIHGKMLGEVEDSLSYEDKLYIGKQIRNITDKLNAPCENFTPSQFSPKGENGSASRRYLPVTIDVKQYAIQSDVWDKEGFPPSFQKERLAYLNDFHIDESAKAYCHGDFHFDNVLIDDDKKAYLIDFADAMYAPAPYEQVYVLSAFFCFEKPYMTGYFGGDYNVEEIVDLCMIWLPVHAWGHATIKGNFDTVEEISSFTVMREKLQKLIETEKNK